MSTAAVQANKVAPRKFPWWENLLVPSDCQPYEPLANRLFIKTKLSGEGNLVWCYPCGVALQQFSTLKTRTFDELSTGPAVHWGFGPFFLPVKLMLSFIPALLLSPFLHLTSTLLPPLSTSTFIDVIFASLLPLLFLVAGSTHFLQTNVLCYWHFVFSAAWCNHCYDWITEMRSTHNHVFPTFPIEYIVQY